MTAIKSIYSGPMNLTIRTADLVRLARDLRSEQGENKEYDRALVELVTDALGVSMEFKSEIATMLGIKSKTRRR